MLLYIDDHANAIVLSQNFFLYFVLTNTQGDYPGHSQKQKHRDELLDCSLRRIDLHTGFFPTKSTTVVVYNKNYDES